MRLSELEGWIPQVADAVKAKHPNEDSRVELKSVWLAPTDMARHLGGHANAAHGEPILWIIGLDEKSGVVGVEKKEIADWLPGMESEFESVSPTLIHSLNVAIEDVTLVGLYFATDRAPYVVKNPKRGQPNCGPIDLEVPWRKGTSTRSARREDLMRILVPKQRFLLFDILKGAIEIKLEKSKDATSEKDFSWELTVEMYVEPPSLEMVVIPFHRCAATIIKPFGSENLPLEGFRVYPPTSGILLQRDGDYESNVLSKTVRSTPSEAIFSGPGLVNLTAKARTNCRPMATLPNDFVCRVDIAQSRAEEAQSFKIVFSDRAGDLENRKRVKWKFVNGEYHSFQSDFE